MIANKFYHCLPVLLAILCVSVAGCRNEDNTPPQTEAANEVADNQTPPDSDMDAADEAAAVGNETSPEPCTNEWFTWVEEEISSDDGMGHGPDPGSLEWKSSIAFRLGLRGKDGVPLPDSDSWCEYIDQLIRSEKG